MKTKSSKKAYCTFYLFLFIAFLIVVLHLLFHPIRVLGMNTSIFYMDEKYTLAAYFSTITAFLTGYLSFISAFGKTGKKQKLASLAFALFFLILSFDEYFEVHEYANTIIKKISNTNSLLGQLAHLSWVFPLSVIIIFVFYLFFLKFLHSPKIVRHPIILGCICFALVLIVEVLGSATYGQNIYLYFVAIEEGLEMVGVSFFLLSVLLEG